VSDLALAWYNLPIIWGLSAVQIWIAVGPFASGVLAALITHNLTRRRDQENHRLRLEEEARVAARRVRRERLLEAYRALDASEPQRVAFQELAPNAYAELIKKMAAAYSDINLFGDEELAAAIDEIIARGSEYDTSIIMNLLRDRLRVEYGLEPTRARYKWVEVKLNKTVRPNSEEQA
jgi:hypothetical protein